MSIGTITEAFIAFVDFSCMSKDKNLNNVHCDDDASSELLFFNMIFYSALAESKPKR